MKLQKKYKYALPGKISSDRTEGEFGIYRQSSGGNFLVYAEQVFNGLHLQRIKLYSKLDIHTDGENVDNDCCVVDIIDSEHDLELVEQCFEKASSLNEIDKYTLYYICGYIAWMENIVCVDRDTAASLPQSKFAVNLSRGCLYLPPVNLYDLSLYYYSFFKSKEVKCCTKIFLQAFEYIHDYTGYNYPNIEKINRRFCNTFFKAFVKNATDKISAEKKTDQHQTKRRRISSM